MRRIDNRIKQKGRFRFVNTTIGGVICLLLAGQAFGQSASLPPCYDVAAIIQGPICPGIGPQPTFATGISPNDRYVSGYYCTCLCGSNRAFVYDIWTHQLITLQLPAGIQTAFANDVSDDGRVVGHMGGPIGDFGFIYEIATGQYTFLQPGIAEDGTCTVNAINSSGTVCGTRTISEPALANIRNAFIWSEKDGFTDLGVMNGPRSEALDIAEDGTIAGWTGAGMVTPGARAFIHRAGVTTILDVLPGALTSAAVSINNRGHAAIHARTQLIPGLTRGAFYDGDNLIDIGVLPGFDKTFAAALDDQDTLVGHCTRLVDENTAVAFVWKDGVMFELSSLVEGLFDNKPAAMSPSGHIVGRAATSGDVVAYVLTPVRDSGDANCDEHVDVNDLLLLIGAWGPCTNCRVDFNNDEVVNVLDLLIVIFNWTE